MNQACVDEEAFLESIVLDEHRHLFLHQTASPELFIEGFLHERTANLIYWFTVTLFKALIVAEVLVVRSFHDALLVQLLKYLGQHTILNIASDGLTTLDHLSPTTLTVLLLVSRQSEKLRQALNEASLRIKYHLALQFVHPVL